MNKLKITSSQLKEVEKLRLTINNHRDDEDKKVASLIKKMKLKGDDADILWDFIYNDSYWMVQIKNDKQRQTTS
jgi:hypothetical protein